MNWIPVTPRRIAFNGEMALKLHGCDSQHVTLSVSLWEDMERPARVAVFFSPETGEIGLLPSDAPTSYKVFCYDAHGRGEITRVYINAGLRLRQVMRDCGFIWTEERNILPVIKTGEDLWVTVTPITPEEEL